MRVMVGRLWAGNSLHIQANLERRQFSGSSSSSLAWSEAFVQAGGSGSGSGTVTYYWQLFDESIRRRGGGGIRKGVRRRGGQMGTEGRDWATEMERKGVGGGAGGPEEASGCRSSSSPSSCRMGPVEIQKREKGEGRYLKSWAVAAAAAAIEEGHSHHFPFSLKMPGSGFGPFLAGILHLIPVHAWPKMRNPFVLDQ
ncbi:hypothetical protein Dimus_037471 [Dionaea muscipula]